MAPVTFRQSVAVSAEISTFYGRTIMSHNCLRYQNVVILLVLLAALALPTGADSHTSDPSAPPVATVRVVTDEYFGVKVPDPYRYMEDLTNPEVTAWFKGQNDYTRGVLARISGRATLLERIKTLDEGAPARITDLRRLPGDRYFYQKRLASEDVAKLYVRDGLKSNERILVDPTKFATPGGPHYVISYYAPSFDGKYVAAGVSAAGSEDAVLRVFDTSTAKETGDVIDRAQFGSPAWMPDGRSLLYNRLQQLTPTSAQTDACHNSRTYPRVRGTPREKDRRVFGAGTPSVNIDPADIPFVGTWPGASHALGVIAHGVRNEITVYVAPLDSLNGATVPWKRFCDVDDDVTGFDVHGGDLYLLSHHGASRYKVLHTKLADPDVARAELVVPPGEAVIQNIAAAGDALYIQELDGGLGRLVQLSYSGGKPEKIQLPFDGSVGLSATEPRVHGTLVELASWTKARKIYVYDPSHKNVTDTQLQPVGKFDTPADLESVEVKAKSYDGTLIPLSVVYRKGTKLDGSNPTLLEGYGAYGITLDPFFDPKYIAWFEKGGIFAVAHVRGGGEYGEDWHLAGKLLTKPNTWRDFIACAEYLINQKYTTTSHLSIQGGSAGGITIGRSITERPDLFAAAIDAVPMSDVVRAEFTPNGPPNIPEFGTVKEADGFKALYEMSGYHHVKDGTAYPAVMVTTGWNDPRVDYDAGHGIGSTKTQREEELADEWSFALWQFGVADFQPAKP